MCCGFVLIDSMPIVQVKGWRAYTAAVANLFDPAVSRADLISIRPVDDRTIEMRWRLEGVLKLPGRPRIKPYTGTTRCSVSQHYTALRRCSYVCAHGALIAGTT